MKDTFIASMTHGLIKKTKINKKITIKAINFDS